jgi:predicted nuclease of predicted toxin-antitoxin system
LNFLADESCDFRVVRALREAGHDVLAVCEFAKRMQDQEVMNLSGREERVLITEDKDFGQLIYAHGTPSRGVIHPDTLPCHGSPATFQRHCKAGATKGRSVAG